MPNLQIKCTRIFPPKPKLGKEITQVNTMTDAIDTADLRGAAGTKAALSSREKR